MGSCFWLIFSSVEWKGGEKLKVAPRPLSDTPPPFPPVFFVSLEEQKERLIVADDEPELNILRTAEMRGTVRSRRKGDCKHLRHHYFEGGRKREDRYFCAAYSSPCVRTKLPLQLGRIVKGGVELNFPEASIMFHYCVCASSKRDNCFLHSWRPYQKNPTSARFFLPNYLSNTCDDYLI